MTLRIKRHSSILPRVHISTSSKWICYLSLFSILAVIGVIFHNEYIGQITIILIGVIAVIYGVKSEESFLLALTAFCIIIISTVLRIDVLAQHFATYAFLFLCIGLVCAIKEQKNSPNDVLIKSYISGAYSRNYKAMPKGKRVFISRRMQ